MRSLSRSPLLFILIHIHRIFIVGGAGVGQFIRVLVEGVAVQAMGEGVGVIFCKDLLDERIGVFFQVVDAGGIVATFYLLL